MTTRRDEEELQAIKEAVERVKEAKDRIKENYRALEEIGEVLCRLLQPYDLENWPGGMHKSTRNSSTSISSIRRTDNTVIVQIDENKEGPHSK